MDEKTIAIQALVRRGIRPIDVKAANAALIAHNGERNMRGNVSQQKGHVRTSKSLDALRAKRRAKLETR